MAFRRIVGVGLIVVACAAPVVLTPTAAQTPTADEIQRRISQWESDPVLRQFANAPQVPNTATQSPVTNPPTIPAKTKIAYCYGVNRTDPAWYGSDNPLEGPENDANDLARVATSLNFDTKTRLTPNANSRQLFADIQDAAGKLDANDVLFLSYSGHGDRPQDANGHDAWCLYDREVIGNELAAAWPQFKQGVKVYVVADSCHSGTSIRTLDRMKNPLSLQNSRGLRALANPGSGGVTVRTLSPANHKLAVDRQLPAFKNLWDSTPRAGQSEANTRAAVLLLAACQDEELAGERGGHGLFTSALIQLGNNGRFQGTYRDLISQATDRIADPSQHPNLFQVGAMSINIETDRPFGH
jgi:metacaspase-1